MIANARMYSVAPAATAAWKGLLHWVIRVAGLDWEVIEHAAPAPIAELWARSDLGCVFMCGLPFAQARPQPRLIAAPVPSLARYGNQPIYFTDLIVRADAPFLRLEDTFGRRLAYTSESSQSGYNAVRTHLLAYRSPGRPTLYSATVGPLGTPRRVLEAIVAGEADVGPLDSYAHDLLRRHEPALANRVRTIATTRATPIPVLIAAPSSEESMVERVREALLAVSETPELAATCCALLLNGFAAPSAREYDVLLENVLAARGAGYAHLA
jgi:ABC-type phosphate/phosphonate transport system substrate-binding protein